MLVHRPNTVFTGSPGIEPFFLSPKDKGWGDPSPVCLNANRCEHAALRGCRQPRTSSGQAKGKGNHDRFFREWAPPLIMQRAFKVMLVLLIVIPVGKCLTNLEGGIGLLLLGDVGRAGSPINDWLDQDLIIDYFEIPMAQRSLSEAELVKYTAIYLPRTLKRLLELYDMIVICEEEELFVWYTTVKQQMMMHEAVGKEGVALFNAVANEDYEEARWAATTLAELMPHDYAGDFKILPGSFRIAVDLGSDLPPIFTPFAALGIERYAGSWCRRLYPKIGSTIWAQVVPHNAPFFVSWIVGDKGARTSNVANDLDEPWWGSSMRGQSSANPYGGDLFLNMVYWSVGKEPIVDIYKVHMLRASLADYLLLRSVTISIVEFIDRFGANVVALEEDLALITEGRSVARQLYFEQRYDEAISHVASMFEAMQGIERKAVELKKRAFLWMYLVEWSVVTGALFVIAFVTWSLMVRRRLYREVGMTSSLR